MSSLEKKIASRAAKICVIGLGYVGLPTAVLFAKKGFRVIGCDNDRKKVSMIRKGKCYLRDLDLDAEVRKVVATGKLEATTRTTSAVKESDVVLIIVPTPIKKNKKPDLSFVKMASKDISKGIHGGLLVVLESTVYPGVTEEVVKSVLEKSGLRAGKDFGLAYCPERYNPGDKQHTIEKVARIVGGITPQWGRVAKKLYETVIKEKVTQVRDIKTAEAGKVIENVQRDLNIALVNEYALIFERMGLDVIDVIKAASTKWNFNTYWPGAGVGGHCLPVDPYYLVEKARDVGYDAKLITAGRKINEYMPIHVFSLLKKGLKRAGKELRSSRVVVLGYSYKANVGDPREAPTKTLLQKIKKSGAKYVVVDPYIDGAYFDRNGIKHEKNAAKAIKGADAVVLMTFHDSFKKLSLKRIKALAKKPVVLVDGRRVFNPDTARKQGMVYLGIGAGEKNGK